MTEKSRQMRHIPQRGQRQCVKPPSAAADWGYRYGNCQLRSSEASINQKIYSELIGNRHWKGHHTWDSPGKEKQNRCSLRCCLNTVNDEAEVTCSGSVFQMRAPSSSSSSSSSARSLQRPKRHSFMTTTNGGIPVSAWRHSSIIWNLIGPCFPGTTR